MKNLKKLNKMDIICYNCELYREMNKDFSDEDQETELSPEDFIKYVEEQDNQLLDFNLIYRFYCADYQMTDLEIKKLCYTMTYVDNLYQNEALILAKHRGIFDYLFESEKDLEIHSDLYNRYKDLIKTDSLDITSIACGSFYFTSANDCSCNFKIMEQQISKRKEYKVEYNLNSLFQDDKRYSELTCHFDKIEILKICCQYEKYSGKKVLTSLKICIDRHCFHFLLQKFVFEYSYISNYFLECLEKRKL